MGMLTLVNSIRSLRASSLNTVYLPIVIKEAVEKEPNNSLAEANEVTNLETSYKGYHAENESDFFKIRLPSRGKLNLNLNLHEPSFQTSEGEFINNSVQLIFLDNSGVRIDHYGSPPFSINALDIDSGTYFVEVLTVVGNDLTNPYFLDISFEPISTPTPTATSTNTPSPTPTEDINAPNAVVNDSFDSGELNSTYWDEFTCVANSSGRVENQALTFVLNQNQSGGWEACALQPTDSTVSDATSLNYLRIESIVTLESGISSPESRNSFIGLFASCGDAWLNMLMSPDGAIVTGSGGNPAETLIEEYSSSALPITRKLSAEWDGTNVVFGIYDGPQINGQLEVPCGQMPNYFSFGAGTNNGGAMAGKIDDIRIWSGINPIPPDPNPNPGPTETSTPTPTPSPTSTPNLPPETNVTPYPTEEYDVIRNLDIWNLIGDEDSFTISQEKTKISIDYKTPNDGKTRFLGFSQSHPHDPYNAIRVRMKLERTGGPWDLIHFGTSWDTDGDTSSFDEDYYVVYGYGRQHAFIDVYETGESGRILLNQTLKAPPNTPFTHSRELKVENHSGTLYFYIDENQTPIHTWTFPELDAQNAYAEFLQFEAFIEQEPINDLAGYWEFLRLRPYQ